MFYAVSENLEVSKFDGACTSRVPVSLEWLGIPSLNLNTVSPASLYCAEHEGAFYLSFITMEDGRILTTVRSRNPYVISRGSLLQEIKNAIENELPIYTDDEGVKLVLHVALCMCIPVKSQNSDMFVLATVKFKGSQSYIVGIRDRSSNRLSKFVSMNDKVLERYQNTGISITESMYKLTIYDDTCTVVGTVNGTATVVYSDSDIPNVGVTEIVRVGAISIGSCFVADIRDAKASRYVSWMRQSGYEAVNDYKNVAKYLQLLECHSYDIEIEVSRLKDLFDVSDMDALDDAVSVFLK